MNTGDRFGKLIFVAFEGTSKCRVRCDCGTEKIVTKANLSKGSSRSCGCARMGKAYTRHYLSPECRSDLQKTYNAWVNMKSRCYRPSHRCWESYGGRGIKVSLEWVHSFPTFLSDMGTCPEGYSLERNDVNGNYCRENCRWIPLPDQSLNTTKTRKVFLNGESLPFKVACRKAGFDPSAVNFWRKRKGISAQEALDRFLLQPENPATHWITFEGERLNSTEACRRAHIHPSVLATRSRRHPEKTRQEHFDQLLLESF